METIRIKEKRLKALESLKAVENKIKSLHVIEYGDYWDEYIKAFVAFTIAYTFEGLKDFHLLPYELECLEYKAQDEYYGFIEDLEDEGYCVRW